MTDQNGTFKIVDRSHIPARGGRSKEASELSLAFARGEVVFLPSPHGSAPLSMVMGLYNKGSYLRNHGFQPRQRRGIEEGVEGLFIWAERVSA